MPPCYFLLIVIAIESSLKIQKESRMFQRIGFVNFWYFIIRLFDGNTEANNLKFFSYIVNTDKNLKKTGEKKCCFKQVQ